MPVDSNDDATPKLVGGVTGKGFKPGVSGNPSGRVPAERTRLRSYILEELTQGAIDGIVDLARKARSEKIRLEALVWIAEQGVGRAPVSIAAEDGTPLLGLVILPSETL